MPGSVAATPVAWQEANRLHLDAALRRLRLLLHRRVLWLRKLWSHDPLQGYQGMVISDAQADGLLAGGDHDAERRFYREDPEAASISCELEAVEREWEVTREARPGLEILARAFRLNAFDRDVLSLCVAPEIDPAFERLYAYVQDDATRKYPTIHLALTLFADPRDGREAGRGRFLPESPLRRHRLIRLESPASIPQSCPRGTLASEPLRLDPRISDYILGLNRMDEQVATVVKRVDTSPLLTDQQQELVGRVERLLKGEKGRSPVSAFSLVGPPRVGRKAIACAICERLGITLHDLDLARLPAAAREARELARLLDREAALLPIAYYLDLSDVDPSNRVEFNVVKELVEETQALTFLASRDGWQGERAVSVLPVPRPDASERRSLWQAALSAAGDALTIGNAGEPGNRNGHASSPGGPASRWDGILSSIVQQFDFGPQEIQRAVQRAGLQVRLGESETSQADDELWQACRLLAAQPGQDVAQRLNGPATWGDIVLPADTVRQLRELAAQVAHRGRVYEDWGFGARLSRGRGIGALFAGPSGTGKTMAAEVLANHLKLDVYRIDLSGVVSKYIGETEKNLRRVFDAAEQSGAILFFDEADALFGKRSEVKDSHDRYANIEINYLLQRMEEYRGMAILATNMKSLLDEAFLRRLRFLIDFPFPDAEHRLKIWRQVFPPQAAVENLDYRFLARLEIAGGNIKNIAVNAAFLAAGAGGPIRMEHLFHAARREYAKIDKLVMESEFGPYFAEMRP